MTSDFLHQLESLLGPDRIATSATDRLIYSVDGFWLPQMWLDRGGRRSQAGAIVYPPVPAFYARPESLEDMVDHTLGRVLDLFDIDLGVVKRWSGDKTRPQRSEPVASDE